MFAGSLPDSAADLFSHVTADKTALYRAILEIFAAAKRQFRLHLRPDEVLADAYWPDGTPTLEEVQAALAQLTAWGNLQAQPDTARVSTIEDFYRKRLLYRMTAGGEAVEASLEVFVQTLARRTRHQGARGHPPPARPVGDFPMADVGAILKQFESPDETRIFPLGKFELTRCPVEHVGLVLSGIATAVFDGGTVVELRAGQLFYIPATPHDSWVIGDEPYVSLHFLGAEHYAATYG